jgi:hypothetical protein
MPRMRKPENESEDEAKVRRVLEQVANHASRPEKTSWQRKRDNMESMVRQLRPLEDKILEIYASMQPIKDDIEGLRYEMVKDCIHPFDLLKYKPDEDGNFYVECKFCESKMRPAIFVEDDGLGENE